MKLKNIERKYLKMEVRHFHDRNNTVEIILEKWEV